MNKQSSYCEVSLDESYNSSWSLTKMIIAFFWDSDDNPEESLVCEVGDWTPFHSQGICDVSDERACRISPHCIFEIGRKVIFQIID